MEMSQRIELIIHYQLQKHFWPVVAYLGVEVEDLTQDIQAELARLAKVKPFDEKKGTIETYVYNAVRATTKSLRRKKNALMRSGETISLEDYDFYYDPDATEDAMIEILDNAYCPESIA